MKKINVTSSGVFTIKEYQLEEGQDFLSLVSMLQRGTGRVREVISYVFEGEDPLGIDAKSFSPEEFINTYPRMLESGYGPGLAFDVIVETEGQSVTVELTQGSPVVSLNSLDKEAELESLLGEPGRDEMDPDALLRILAVAERLKCNTRHCDTSTGRRESVAEHSWRAALMAMLLGGQKEYAGLDMDRVIRMCLIHDLGEAFTGDVPSFQKTDRDKEEEDRLRRDWVRSFPDAQRREFEALFAEMEECRTPEARIYKAIDKLEAVIQHNEADTASWLPLEYDLQMTYGREEAACSDFLLALRDRLDLWTQDKIRQSGRDQSS